MTTIKDGDMITNKVSAITNKVSKFRFVLLKLSKILNGLSKRKEDDEVEMLISRSGSLE